MILYDHKLKKHYKIPRAYAHVLTPFQKNKPIYAHNPPNQTYPQNIIYAICAQLKYA